MAEEDRIDIDFELHEDEEIIEVFETGEKDLPGIVLTNQRLLFAAIIEDQIKDEDGKVDRFAQKIVGKIQSRLRNGIKLENLLWIVHEGDKLKIKMKLSRFLPASRFDIPLEDDIDRERFLEFVERVKKQAGLS